MNVAAILDQKGRAVITAAPQTSLLEVSKILAREKIGSLVVVDDNKQVVGIASERDIVRIIAEKGPPSLSQPISSCMTEKVITCKEHDTIDTLMSQMTGHRFRHMPVVEGDDLIGIVSIGDVVKHRIAEAEMEAESMRQYIAAG